MGYKVHRSVLKIPRNVALSDEERKSGVCEFC